MPYILTTGSTVQCPHGGTVALQAGQTKLKVDGSPALIEGDLDNATISGCSTVTNPNTGDKQCTMVVGMSSGAATELKVSNKAVLLETASGTTDGVSTTGNVWHVQTAGQITFAAQ
jgi:hypothetical protein